MRRIWIGAVLLIARASWAAPPEHVDPTLARWFNNLRAPWTNALCCTVADYRPVASRRVGNHYEVLIADAWRKDPDDTVMERKDNPTGRAVACWTPQAGVLCFVPAPES